MNITIELKDIAETKSRNAMSGEQQVELLLDAISVAKDITKGRGYADSFNLLTKQIKKSLKGVDA